MEAPHSAAHFGPHRDFWWNRDQLELIAARRGLREARRVLDVGSGVGHWSRLLLPLCAPDATFVGVEREPEWVREATRRADDRCRYVEGAAEALPFADGSFDLVTCQTVLMHVPDVPAVLAEMRRVTAPGGQVLVAEPNNRAALVVGTSVTTDMLDLLTFVVTCERGKETLGEGDNSVGDLLPGLFAAAGLTDVAAYLCDKPAALVPPYASEAQQVLKAMLVDEAREGGFGGWSRAQAERYFLAGGGGGFAAAWERRLAEARATAAALEAGTYHTAGGMLLYVVTGRV